MREHTAKLALLLTVYVFLALFRIDHQSLWVDEIYSIWTSGTVGDLPFWYNGQGPLYFALLHLWAKLGSDDGWLRLLSVLIGFVGVCGFYALAMRLMESKKAWIPAALFATSPFVIWYSQEVRYVALTTTTSVFAMYAFNRALSVNRLACWLLYSFSLVLVTASFVANVSLAAVQTLYFVSSKLRRQHIWKPFAVSLIIFALLFVLWANRGKIDQLAGYWGGLWHDITSNDPASSGLRSGGEREFTLAAFPYTFFTFSAGLSLGPSVRELQVSRSLHTLAPYTATIAIMSCWFGGLFITGWIALKRDRTLRWFLLLWLLVPIAAVLGVSAVTHMAYNIRYVAASLPAFLLFLAYGIASAKRKAAQVILLGGVLLANGLSLANYYFNPRYAREDARSAAQYLESAAKENDVILVIGSSGALSYYYQGDLPILSWSRDVVESESKTREALQALSMQYRRIWLVVIRPWEKDRKGLAKASLDASSRLVEHRQFAGAVVCGYDKVEVGL